MAQDEFPNCVPRIDKLNAQKVVVAWKTGNISMGPGTPLPPPFQLPTDIPKFTGRLVELAEVESALACDSAVVAVCGLWGMGGIGKSALAIHVAYRLHTAGRFQDGILWADLGATGLHEVTAGFISAFGYDDDQIPDNPGQRLALYRSMLHGKDVLIGLDNAQDDATVQALLPNSPTAAVIVTSRRHMVGLKEYATLLKDLDVFDAREAAELLGRYIGGDRVDAESGAVATICELAGYLPLALAVAGARLADAQRWPHISTFAERLQDERRRLDEFSIGESGDRNLRAVFGVSYYSLPTESRRIFSALALFGDADFGSSALVALLDIHKLAVIDELEGLVELALLLRSARGGYRLHDLLRIFASECVTGQLTTDQMHDARERLQSFLSLRVEAAHLGGVASSCARTGRLNEAIAAYLDAVKINRELSDRNGEASSLGGLAAAYARKGDWPKAIEYYQASLRLNEEVGSLWDQATTLGGLASVYARKGDSSKAVDNYKKSLVLHEEVGNPAGQASTLGGLASVYAGQRDWFKAIEYYEKSLVLNKKVGNLAGEASAYGGLAAVYAKKRDWDKAIDNYERAQALNVKVGDPSGQASAFGGLAAVYARKGDWSKAIEYYDKAQVLNEEVGNPAGQASAFGGLASVYAKKGDWSKAIEYYGKAQEINIRLGDRRNTIAGCLGLATAYLRLNNSDAAISQYRDAVRVQESMSHDRDACETYLRLAQVCVQCGRTEDARDYAAKAAALGHGDGLRRAESLLKQLPA